MQYTEKCGVQSSSQVPPQESSDEETQNESGFLSTPQDDQQPEFDNDDARGPSTASTVVRGPSTASTFVRVPSTASTFVRVPSTAADIPDIVRRKGPRGKSTAPQARAPVNEDLVGEVQRQQVENRQISQQLSTLLQPTAQANEMMAWGTFLGTGGQSLHQNLRHTFYQRTLDVLTDLQRETRRMSDPIPSVTIPVITLPQTMYQNLQNLNIPIYSSNSQYSQHQGFQADYTTLLPASQPGTSTQQQQQQEPDAGRNYNIGPVGPQDQILFQGWNPQGPTTTAVPDPAIATGDGRPPRTEAERILNLSQLSNLSWNVSNVDNLNTPAGMDLSMDRSSSVPVTTAEYTATANLDALRPLPQHKSSPDPAATTTSSTE